MTGVWPAKHGIYSNHTFDPLGGNFEGWYWYSEDIAVPTLWEAAAKAGLTVGNVSWPVSVGAKGIRYNVPEYWRAPKSADDLKLLRAVSTPGLVAEIAQEAGPYIADLDDAIPGDWARTRYAAWILRHGKPQFMTVHLAALDHLEHATGPFSPESNDTLEQIDAMLGQLEDAARTARPDYAVCVVSDHGFSGIDHSLNLMKAFAGEGLVTLGQGSGFLGAPLVVDWKAFPKADGGSAAILLKDPKEEATRVKVGQLLRRLAPIRPMASPGCLTGGHRGHGRQSAGRILGGHASQLLRREHGGGARHRRKGGTHGYRRRIRKCWPRSSWRGPKWGKVSHSARSTCAALPDHGGVSGFPVSVRRFEAAGIDCRR